MLVLLYLRYDPAEQALREWPPVDSSEVLFGGEYVRLGDSPDAVPDAAATPAQESAPAPEPVAEALENSGTPAPVPAPPVQSQRPSPAKVVAEKPEQPTGPSKAEREAAERARREQEARQAIASRVSFGHTGSGGAGRGSQGSPDGNSNTGAASGAPGFNLSGRTIASWTTPDPGPLGSITVSVVVNRQGEVVEATYVSGSGAAATNTATRRSCVAAARRSKFSVDLNAPATQKGTITYHFR